MSSENGNRECCVSYSLVYAGFNGLYHGVGVSIKRLLEFDGFSALDAADVPVGCDSLFM